MKAVIRHAYGSPEVLELAEVERPVPGEGEVLVRVRATSLNASDWENLRGKPLYGRLWGFFTPKIRILGSDVAGTVAAVGPEVIRFAPGDAVYGDLLGSWGGFAEWVCAPETRLRPKPESMSFDEAAAIPQSGAIALQGLRDKGQVQPGQSVLINGAGGSAGTFAIQIAKLLGAEVTGVDNAHKLELMRSLGADHVIDYAEEDFTRSARRYDLILDLVGHHSLFDFKRALAPRGRYLVVGGPMKLLFGVLFLGSLVSLFTRKKMGLLAVEVNQGLDVLEGHFQSGAVVPVIDRRYPLSETPEALRRLGEGRALGKLVIVEPLPPPRAPRGPLDSTAPWPPATAASASPSPRGERIATMNRTAPVPALALSALLALAAPAAGQPSPYAEHAEREIKALSPEEVDRYLTGQGMGLALPAELNGYPGPKHVLELAAELGLTDEQRDAVSGVYDPMVRQAIDLGWKIVEAERRLDALFAEAEATPEALRAALDHLATLQAALRYTHLEAHLETRALLTEAQLAHYTHLRGYASEGTHSGSHHGHQ